MKRVVIVGGGITGLAAAHALEKAAKHALDVKILEASDHLGGNIRTVTHNACIIDAGPDSWVASKPHATRLAKEVGLADELIGTRSDTRKVYIVWQRRLHPMPGGLILGVPTEWKPFAESDLLGLDAKLRAGLDLFVPKKDLTGDADESISAFVTRRLGSEIGERIVGPLLGGIFAGDPDQLSVRACVPQLVEAEAKYGSLVMAMRAMRRARKSEQKPGEEQSAFLSLKRGVGDLVVNVAHRLRDAEILRSTPVTGIARESDGWRVETAERVFEADHVVLALASNVAGKLLGDVDPDLASLLGDVAYVSTATIFLAYRKFDVRHPLDAHGFLVPKSEGRPILAATFVSSKWEDRVPSGQVLIRVFVGGAQGQAVLGRDDEDLVRVAREQLQDLIGIDRPPSFSRVFRFQGASPQPHIGHLSRMERVFARMARHPGLYAGGNGYVGTGISDSIKQGEDIAARIIASPSPSPSP